MNPTQNQPFPAVRTGVSSGAPRTSIQGMLAACTLMLVVALTAPALADDTVVLDPANSDARAPVMQLEDTLLSVMKRADELGFDGRLREITPVVQSTFDLPFMAKTSIGRTWKNLTPEVQSRWVDTFTRYTTTKLADQFDAFSGQIFVLKGERPASRGTLIVMSRVEREGKEPVRLDFRVRNAGESWLIIDIYGKGKVSEVALRRSEYAAILEKNGIDGLIESVDALSAKTASK